MANIDFEEQTLPGRGNAETLNDVFLVVACLRPK